MSDPLFLVIAGSVRPNRISPDVTRWIAGIGRSIVPATFEVIDLRDWPLPMDDESGIPTHADYARPHTLAWSRKIASADGILFVTPQYNWGYPAALKNAIDHLYAEWRGKPAAIITYGGHGGGKCAAQLREVLTGLKMRLAGTMPALTLTPDQIRANNGSIDPDAAFAADRPMIITALNELCDLASSRN